MADSPFAGLAEDKWKEKTKKLIGLHPLRKTEIVEIVLQSWNDIFQSKLGSKGFQIGKHIYPKPQIMGFLLHELITLEVSARYPDKWRGDKSAVDKDLVYIPNDKFSIEIKTSSHPAKIFGNRSYAQEGKSAGKKIKSGYYLTVNFGKCSEQNNSPAILQIRFGWLDHTDWIGQTTATGQQAHLTAAADKHKLLVIYPGK